MSYCRFSNILLFISLILICFSNTQAANKKILQEISIYRNSTSLEKIIKKSKNFTRTVSEIPRRKKFRSGTRIEFNNEFNQSTYYNAVLINENEQEDITTQIWDLNNNGIQDMRIKKKNQE